MPTIRYEIRNEYGLADPGLYHSAHDDESEVLHEGVTMAGLVGILRQLGDLAEFAAEIFSGLHEEATTTAARGHGLMLRLRQMEAEFPLIEKDLLLQTKLSPLAYNEGINWHANLRLDHNLVTRGDMPRFILDTYEECRGPPRLFVLDKFDVAGAGACLKRYSDPSAFRVGLAASGIMEEEVREKKAHKVKKKRTHWRHGEDIKSFLVPLVRSNLQPVTSEKISAKVRKRHIKLKSRNLRDSDIANKRSYMEHLLQSHLPEKIAIIQVEPATEVHTSLTSIIADSPKLKEESHPVYEFADVETETFTPASDENTMIEPIVKAVDTVSDYSSTEAEKSYVYQQKSFVDTQITLMDEFDGHGSTEDILGNCCSKGVETDPSPFAWLDEKNSLFPCEISCESNFDGYRSNDLGCEMENMDAYNNMQSDTETASDTRQESDPGDDGNHMLVSSCSTSCSLDDTLPYQDDSCNFNEPAIPETCLKEHVITSEEIRIINTVDESIPPIHLLTKGSCDPNGSKLITTTPAAIEAYSGSCVQESTSSGNIFHSQASNESPHLNLHPLNESFLASGEDTGEISLQLTSKNEVPKATDFYDATEFHSPDIGPSFSVGSDSLKEIHLAVTEMSDTTVILNDATEQFNQTMLLTVEEPLHASGEQSQSVEEATELVSVDSILLSIASMRPAVVNSDAEGMEKSETLATEISANNLTLAYDVGENLEEKLPINLGEYVVPERDDTEEESEELFLNDLYNTQADNFPLEVQTPSDDTIVTFDEDGTETCPVLLAPNVVAATVDDGSALSHDSTDEYIQDTEIPVPNFLPLEFEQLSIEEEAEESHEVDPAELSAVHYVNNAFSEEKNLQSANLFCMVKEEENIEKNKDYDDLLDEYVIVEDDNDDRASSLRYSSGTSFLDIELQEDYLPETNETYYPESFSTMPCTDDQKTSSLTDLCSEFQSDDVCQMTATEPDISKESTLSLSESEDAFSRGGMNLPISILVEPATEPDTEASDIQQTVSQDNCKDEDSQSLETPICSSPDSTHEQEAEAAVPSETTELSITGPSIPPFGFLYPMGENTSMFGEMSKWKPRSLRDLPRNPLIEAVAAHDKSTLRKISELEPQRARPKADEKDSLLEQIRNKSFNLKPVSAPVMNMNGPQTNVKLAAILEKANAIRQACVGSDEDDDDSESWNNS